MPSNPPPWTTFAALGLLMASWALIWLCGYLYGRGDRIDITARPAPAPMRQEHKPSPAVLLEVANQ